MKNKNKVKEGEVLNGMCVRWVQDWVPDHGKEKATVEVRVQDKHPDLDGFHSPLPRTLRLIFGLWHHPSWCSGLSSEHELQCHSWVSTSHCLSAHSGWLVSVIFVSLTYTYRQSLQELGVATCCLVVLVMIYSVGSQRSIFLLMCSGRHGSKSTFSSLHCSISWAADVFHSFHKPYDLILLQACKISASPKSLL